MEEYYMQKDLFFCTLALMIFSFGANAHCGSVPRVEVLYMNHGPMQPTIEKLKDIFSMYGEKIAVSWYDLNTREAQQFMAEKGLRGHVPLSISIEGAQTAKLGQRVVKFEGFPSGSGPALFPGDWTMQDFKAALDREISKRR